MKKLLAIIILGLLWSVNGYSEIKCIKGDCKNGFGGAEDKANGKTWVGTFKNGKIVKGSMRALPDIQYKGDFKNFKPDGKGEITMGNLNKFYANQNGLFKNGLFIKGTAKILIKDNFNYNGEMEGMEINGFGLMTFPKGDKYEGKFKNGKFNGEGRYTWASGSTWAGNYSNDKRNGLGVFTSSKGSSTLSNWKNGKLIKKAFSPTDIKSVTNLMELGINFSNNSYYNKKNKPILFYDSLTKSMKECSGSVIAGSCTKYKPYDINSFGFDTLYFNESNGKMQKCNNESLGRCLSFSQQSSSIFSDDQLFYNPRSRSMETCLNPSMGGKCLAFGMAPIKLNNSSTFKQSGGSYMIDSASNPYFKKVPQPGDMLELGLKMLSGGCTLGLNC